MTNSPNIIDTVKSLVSDAALLAQQEARLARAEVGEKIEQVQIGMIGIVSGLLLAFCALLILLQALVVALSNIMAPSLAALLVGVVLAVLAYISVKAGTEQLKAKNLVPERTLNSMRDSAETIKDAA
ncbi:phage holin family protein [Pararhizobium sp. IMCC21322]|uniref:phage holin family protein n=1 Tax=Pararhizobium sp. IMCC21322 TaxID=3067903 RepID=UPI0027406949|nr:phage holin family protein [Pararhizobium sp. IMCC21322]